MKTESYVSGEVIAPADSLEHAQKIAQAYGLKLKQYANGIARMDSSDAKEMVVRSAAQTRGDLPKLSLNKTYTPYGDGGFAPPTADRPASEHRDLVENRRKTSPRAASGEAGDAGDAGDEGDAGDAGEPGQWHRIETDIDRAWSLSTGQGVTVAVVDTGIDVGHPAFAGRILPNSYNAYTDQTGVAHVQDQFGHGTHVCGIIAANMDAAADVCGVAPKANLLVINAINPDTYQFDSFSLLGGINYAVKNGAGIINLSLGRIFGSGADEFERRTIADAVAAGVLVVCAAGNNSDEHAGYPAAYPESFAVSATKRGYQFEDSYSNYGPEVDISAPGSDVNSVNLGGGYRLDSGTSMSAPVVSGVAALVASANSKLTPQQLRDALCLTAQDAGVPGRDDRFGAGIVSAYAALLGPDALHTVRYILDDVPGGVSYTVKAAPGSILLEPDAPPRDGFAFCGWFVQGSDAEFDFAQPLSGNVSLYPKWETPAPGMYLVEFPDSVFRREIMDLITQMDGRRRRDSHLVTRDEKLLASLRVLYLSGKSITDMKGLSYLTGLNELSCWYNQITELDVSHQKELTFLDCSFNGLGGVDLAYNPKLENVWCEYNGISSLDITHNKELQFLCCHGNYMNTPDDVRDWRSQGLVLGETFLYHDQKTIRITAQPHPFVTLTQGNITAKLSVKAKATTGSTLKYQWFADTKQTNREGQPIAGATSATFAIPKTLTPGMFYYHCVVSSTNADDEGEETSHVASVKVVSPSDPWSNPFSDVTGTEWFSRAVLYVREEGIMSGTSANKFTPAAAMTGAMLATILYKLEGSPNAKNETWYSDAVAWAERNEILRDCINNDFDWHAPLTREQGIVTLHGYARFQGKDTGVRDDLSRYTDAGDISQWALDAFRWSVGAGIVVGNTLTTLVPLAPFTRAQSAMVFMKYFTLLT